MSARRVRSSRAPWWVVSVLVGAALVLGIVPLRGMVEGGRLRDVAAPGVPGELSASVGEGIVRLRWGAATGVVDGYRVARDDAVLAEVPATQTRYVDEAPLAGRHRYEVRAVGPGGASSASSVTVEAIAAATEEAEPPEVSEAAPADPAAEPAIRLPQRAPAGARVGVRGTRRTAPSGGGGSPPPAPAPAPSSEPVVGVPWSPGATSPSGGSGGGTTPTTPTGGGTTPTTPVPPPTTTAPPPTTTAPPPTTTAPPPTTTEPPPPTTEPPDDEPPDDD